ACSITLASSSFPDRDAIAPPLCANVCEKPWTTHSIRVSRSQLLLAKVTGVHWSYAHLEFSGASGATQWGFKSPLPHHRFAGRTGACSPDMILSLWGTL